MKFNAKNKITGLTYPVIAMNWDNWTLELQTVVVRYQSGFPGVLFQTLRAADVVLEPVEGDTEPIIPIPTVKTLSAKIGKVEPLAFAGEDDTCKWQEDTRLGDVYDTDCGYRVTGEVDIYCFHCGRPVEVI